MDLPAGPHVKFRGPRLGPRLEYFPSSGVSRVYSSAVEHRIADPAVAGSIPAAPCLLNLLVFFFSDRVELDGAMCVF